MPKLKVSLTPSIKKLEVISKNLINTKMLGRYKSVFKGRGLEFEDFRAYTQDDDASMIDWKTSSRADALLVKEFSEERNLNVFLLIDASSSMMFGSTSKLKSEYAAELVSSLCYAILQANDKVGFAMFNDKISDKVPPAHGFKQFYILSRSLVNVSNYGGKFDLIDALKFTTSFLKEATVLIIVSDFIGLKGDWKKHLKIAASKFDTIGIMVRDPRDKELPDDRAQFVLEDTYSEKQLLVQPSEIRKKFKSYVESNERMIRDTFKQSSSNFISLTTDKSYVKPLMDMFNRRAKQWR